MTHVETRHAIHPDHAKGIDTDTLRRHFLAEGLFSDGEIRLAYPQYDLFTVGGAVPNGSELTLDQIAETKTSNFLDRREMGVVNIGDPGRVEAAAQCWDMQKGDVLYLGMGSGPVTFSGQGRFYITSAHAHRTLPCRLVTVDEAKFVQTGAVETSNRRTIRQFIHPFVMESCQLAPGYTTLEDGSVWNTMPPHVLDGWMEAYLYHGVAPEARVLRLMGQPQEVRHLFVANGQAVISPTWSVHSGAGIDGYTFIWAMAGDNVDYSDRDFVQPGDLR